MSGGPTAKDPVFPREFGEPITAQNSWDFSPAFPARIMIDFENHRVYCETCNGWVPAHNLYIDGRHVWCDRYGFPVEPPEASAHTVWEK